MSSEYRYTSSSSYTWVHRGYIYYDDSAIEVTSFKLSGTPVYFDRFIAIVTKVGYKWKDIVRVKFGSSQDGLSTALANAKSADYNRSFRVDKNFLFNDNTPALSLSGSGTTYGYHVIYLESTDNIEPIEYTLSFDYGQGSGSVTTIQVKYDEVIYQRLPSGMRDKYNLSGWKIAGTSIGSSTKYTWANDMTASAQWTFSGLTLNSSVSSAGGGAIVGAKTQYASGELLSVQAVPNSGYKFDSWTYNGSTITANPLMVNITANSTLVANFKQTGTLSVSLVGSGTYTTETVGDTTNILVTPASGVVNQVEIDGVVFPVEYYSANVWNAGSARSVAYYAKDSTNKFLMTLDYIFADTTIKFHIGTRSGELKNPPSGGTNIEGVATIATVGGEARVNGFDTEDETSVVHLSAVAFNGYTFVGWEASDGTDLSAYNKMSVNIPYSLIKGKIITAKFAQNSSQNINSETNNAHDFL